MKIGSRSGTLQSGRLACLRTQKANRWSRVLELALSKNAIIISPDYRLMPEANGIDIMSDVGCFWTWLHETLPSISQSWHSRPDLSKIACCGESAGGYLSVQSALMFPQSNIKVVISTAAPLNADVPSFRVPRPRLLMGSRPPSPRQAEAIIQNYLKNMKPGAIRTGCEPLDMWELVMCIFQQAYIPRLFGIKGNPVLNIMATLDRLETMPPVWVIHGQSDSLVRRLCHEITRQQKANVVKLSFSVHRNARQGL